MNDTNLLKTLEADYLRKQDQLYNKTTALVLNHHSFLNRKPTLIADLTKVVVAGMGEFAPSFASEFKTAPIYVPVTADVLVELKIKDVTLSPPRVRTTSQAILLVIPQKEMQQPLESVDECMTLLDNIKVDNLLSGDDNEAVNEMVNIVVKMVDVLHLVLVYEKSELATIKQSPLCPS